MRHFIHIKHLTFLALAVAVAFSWPNVSFAGSGAVYYGGSVIVFAEDNGTWLNTAQGMTSAQQVMATLWAAIVTAGYSNHSNANLYDSGNYASIGCSNGVYATAYYPAVPPASLWGSCNANGTSVTLSWSGVYNSDFYPLRLKSASTGEVDVNSFTTSHTFSVIPCIPYDSWVHSDNVYYGTSVVATHYYFTCNAACTPSNICSSGNVVNSCTGALVQSCGAPGCSGGSCISCTPTYTCTDSTHRHNSCTGVDTACSVSQVCSGGSCVAGASCTINGQVVASGSSVPAYLNSSVPYGTLCSTIQETRTCNNGVASGSYTHATCAPLSCVPTYSCSGDNSINSCTGAVTACTASQRCSPSSGLCEPRITTVNQVLKAAPALLRKGSTTHLIWDISDAQNCTVTGTNGDSWTTLTSGAAPGKTSGPIVGQTTYTLSCTTFVGEAVTQSVTVNIVPVYQEM